MIQKDEIKPDMPVCSADGQFAVVDHLEGADSVKLKKDESGVHHFIPLDWITRVDDKVYIDKSTDQIMQEWRPEGPRPDSSESLIAD